MKCGNSGEAATWFSECARMRARPVGPAESAVFHNFARRGPTKEAHRRALDRPDGLLRSVAGQGHGRVLPVTLPRGASDQRKRAEAGVPRSPTPGGTHQGRGWGTHQGRDQGTPTGTDPGEARGPRNRCRAVRRAVRNYLGNSAAGRVRGLDRPRRGRDPAPGRVRPMPSPGGNTTRPDSRRRQARSSSAAGAGQLGRPGGELAACGRSTLTPGRAGWSRGHGSGVPPSAQRHPPGEGAPAPADQCRVSRDARRIGVG
jgi:hypothetical protein